MQGKLSRMTLVNSDNRNQRLFTADMQKVILLPKMTTKEHFFVSRLVVFNETFASMNEEVDFAVLWHEGIAGRLATNVASAYIKCINLSGDTVTVWVDNCSGQNKNWTLFSALVWYRPYQSGMGSTESHCQVSRKGSHIHAGG